MNTHLDILVTTAVDNEAASLLSAMPSAAALRIGGRSFFRANLDRKEVGLLITGPGMINTAQALTALIESMRPSLIVHSGCAGVFDGSGLALGDIGIATRETDIHTGLESVNPICPDPLPFSLLDGSGGIPGRYELDTRLSEEAQTLLSEALGHRGIRMACGPFITVSTITTSDQRARELEAAHAPIMEAMEGAAAAHLARFYRIPLLEIRCAANRVGRRDKAAWNLPLAFDHCGLALRHLIHALAI